MISPIWRRSIRLRLTLWYSAFVVMLLALLVALRLDDVGRPALPEEISDDVHISVLDETGNLLLGQRAFNLQPVRDRLRILSRAKGGVWYVMDFPASLEGAPLWIRCYMSSASASQMMRALLLALIAGVPVLLLLTLVGGNLIAKRALRPLIEITATAESISDSGDLGRRIQLEDRTDEVGRLANAFNSMFERLQRSMEREKRFISDASHELRTPLSVISAQSEFALAPGRTAEEKDAALAVIRERGERAGRMLNQMLLLSRMDSQRLPLHREPLRLAELIEGVADELRASAAVRDMTIRCDADPAIAFEGDELLLSRMLTNLIQNAIQYGRPSGRIDVSLSREGGRIRLCVCDDGPGIPEAEQPRVWERFYQVNKGGGETEGSGLGLPIVRWIAEAHGGAIRLESKMGTGSEFIVELPG